MTVQPAELKRSLSLPLITLYGLGTILGAGIYVLIGEVAAVAGMHMPLSFLLASLLAIFTAFAYAELSARYPFSAGEAVYVQHGFGVKVLSQVVGLAIVIIGVVSSAAISRGFVGYLNVFVHFPDAWVITILVVSMGLIAIWGISESVMVAAIFTLAEILGLLMVLFVAVPDITVLHEYMPQILPSGDELLRGGFWFGVLSGAFLAFYAYIGFEDMVNVAEEVQLPHRNLPLAIILAMVITTIFYVSIALVAITAVPLEDLAGHEAPLAFIYQFKTGSSPVVITLISVFAVINGALIQIIMASRILYGMSRQGWLPKALGTVHHRTRTPLIATLVVTFVVLFFALWLPLVTLAKITSFITLMVFALINLALLRIKKRYPLPPDMQSADIKIYPAWIPATGALVSIAMIMFQLFSILQTGLF